MLKVSWGSSLKGLKSHLAYISGTGKYKNKHKNERVITSKDIADTAKQSDFLDKWTHVLAPDRSKGQRRSKRTDLRLVISWKGRANNEKQYQFLKQFMADNFAGCQFTWARHEKANRLGKAVSHFHVCINPRHLSDGSFLGVSRGDLKKLKVSYQSLSKQLGLATGWEMEAPDKSKQSRTRRERGKRKGRKSSYVNHGSLGFMKGK